MEPQELSTAFAEMAAQANALGGRLNSLEGQQPMEPQELQMAYDAMDAQAAALSSRLSVLEGGDRSGNAHYESLLSHPGLIFEKSMRDPAHYLFGRSPKIKTSNPHVTYDPILDAAHVSLPPRANEMNPEGHIQYRWEAPWEMNEPVVIQHDVMVSQVLQDLATAPGTNGRDTVIRALDNYKFTMLCREDALTYGTGIFWEWDKTGRKDFSTRIRGAVKKLEGRQERDQLASDIADPTRTYFGSGGGYDSQPGPGASWLYGNPKPHPEQWRIPCEKWQRWTYELVRVPEGNRIRVWMADEDYGPACIVASPIDPTRGFLTELDRPVTDWYLEMDTSQGVVYPEDMPDRWCAFRNFVVVRGVPGEDVLGGRPRR